MIECITTPPKKKKTKTNGWQLTTKTIESTHTHKNPLNLRFKVKILKNKTKDKKNWKN
jgi:hypothetical protein